MKPLNWTTKQEQHEYMKKRQLQNIERSTTNSNEKWMAEILKDTGYRWTAQAQWGYRLYDFWCSQLGAAIEVDGPEHREDYDAYRDEYNFRRSGIVVIRVRNRNEDDAKKALEIISKLTGWKERKEQLGIASNTSKGKRKLAEQEYSPDKSMLKAFLEKVGG